MHLVVEILITLGRVLYYCLESFVLFLCPSQFRPGKSVAEEIALVTGAGSGLGRLVSIRLAKLGAKVVLWDLNAEGLKVTKQMIEKDGGRAFDYECDVTDRSRVYFTADLVREDVGNVTMLVNNAGVVSGKTFLETPDEKIQLTMDVNVIAHFWTLKAFLPYMVQKQHGHVVTISSMAGKATCARLVDYCTSKFAAVGLHSALSDELCDSGVNFTNICPTFINTGMFAGVKNRFPMIMPELDQSEVSDRIIRAILLNEAEVIIPPIFNVLVALTTILPLKASAALADLMGHRELMTDFTGRVPATAGKGNVNGKKK